jgi:hypothetical protein
VREPKASKRSLPLLPSEPEALAWVAAWPEPVLQLSEEQRAADVRAGLDTVLWRDGDRMRGFVRVVLRVPLGHPRATVYSVFVEVDREAYTQLKQAFQQQQTHQVEGRLATRLPSLDDAYDAVVTVQETGGEQRARIIATDNRSLRDGPAVGPVVPRTPRSTS